MTSPLRRPSEVVLVGGGHAHVQVLRGLLMRPLGNARVTLVLDEPISVYSGMVPGLVAGQYRAAELEIDVWALAKRAGVAVLHARATGVDAGRRLVHLEGRPPIPFDVASLNVGSTVAGLDVPGVREHALATRPIGKFVEMIARRFDEARLRAGERVRLVVVGGGAAGVELAFALRARAARERLDARVVLIEKGSRVLSDRSERVARRVNEAAAARGIEIIVNARVSALTDHDVVLDGATSVEHDLVLWAPGAAAPPWLRDSDLPMDEAGYLRVRPTLQLVGDDHVFAAGDCAALDGGPRLPRSGVFAVRQGPVLAKNLRSIVTGRSLARYSPQRDSLTLVNLGDGTAIGAKWAFVFEGAWVLRWKDRIDRRFVERFRRTVSASEPAKMAKGAVCGGCAAKVGHDSLRAALARLVPRADDEIVLGLETPDDVAVLKRPGELVVTTIDAFPAFSDDAWLVGRVAAANALSDIEAKGVAPRIALALVTVPRDRDESETLFQVLSGARATLDAAGVTLAGGHTTVGPELVVGFAVTGFAPAEGAILKKAGLRVGDQLILTRALGSGVLLHADMEGRADGRWIVGALSRMTRGNRAAGEIARGIGASASTDVTGFGLAGHLLEMLAGSHLSAELWLAKLPVLPGAVELLAAGLRSTLHASNRRVRVEPIGGVESQPAFELIFDPQTAGGLLFGVAGECAKEAVDRLHEAGDEDAALIGSVVPDDGRGPRIVVKSS